MVNSNREIGVLRSIGYLSKGVKAREAQDVNDILRKRRRNTHRITREKSKLFLQST